ncbi:GNAT family N-acetyltransferase [Kribbella monticola]|uniref:GNAT family N-acetyltransferase n=1 Tax=Kribbella monticola TaxID=2185285 RepID=UPI000DD32091|nr:GNAT family N-acetyltransferase [Kribbella monticola]
MYELIPVATAPELDEEAERRFVEDWPEFIFHDEGVAPYRERRIEYFRDWEFYLVDSDDRRLIAGCWGVPIAWDGTVADLPGGFTDSLARSVESYEAGVVPDTFVLMAAAVRNDEQGKGHAGRVITAVKEQALARGLTRMIAPVRPTSKSQYPLIDIAEFMTWTRDDGLPLDPWLRTHVRLGATLLAPAPASQTMTGSVADWEKWTGMAFPATGTYVIPDGLTTLTIDRATDTGHYQEPNIWLRHA